MSEDFQPPTIVDWTSYPMSSSVDLFSKRGRLAAAALQREWGLRGMFLYSGLFPESMFLLWQEFTVPDIRNAPCSTGCSSITLTSSWPSMSPGLRRSMASSGRSSRRWSSATLTAATLAVDLPQCPLSFVWGGAAVDALMPHQRILPILPFQEAGGMG